MAASNRFVPVTFILLTLLLAALVVGATGCAGTGGNGAGETSRSAEMTAGQFPAKTPPPAEQPPPPMLRDPKTSVYSYLLWISYAYRILNSDVATMAFSENEEVGVNSYVELNRQEGRAIDQRLIDFQIKSVSSKGSTATVAARERWKYRYISTADSQYNSPPYEVTYDSTYTVVERPGKGWLVDEVKAAAVGEEPK